MTHITHFSKIDRARSGGRQRAARQDRPAPGGEDTLGGRMALPVPQRYWDPTALVFTLTVGFGESSRRVMPGRHQGDGVPPGPSRTDRPVTDDPKQLERAAENT